MRKTTTIISSLTIHFLLLSSIPLTTPQPNDKSSSTDIIDQICKKTPFYDLCTSILNSSPPTPKPDLKTIALLMINNILSNATDTLSFIETLIKKTSDREMEQALAFCAESYIPVVKYTLPQAAEAITQNRFGFAGYCVSDAVKEVNSCNKKFLGFGVVSPLGDRNGVVQKLVDVASAIIKQLLKG